MPERSWIPIPAGETERALPDTLAAKQAVCRVKKPPRAGGRSVVCRDGAVKRTQGSSRSIAVEICKPVIPAIIVGSMCEQALPRTSSPLLRSYR